MDRDLKSIAIKIEKMGCIVRKVLASAIDSIVHADPELARDTIAIDRQLDALQRQIQEDAVVVIARHQPVAVHLREILGAIRISGNLERIGDLSKNIAKRAVALSDAEFAPSRLREFCNSGNFVATELNAVLDAFVRRDEWRAEAIWLRNTKIDSDLNRITNALIASMIKNPRDLTTSTQLLFCSKNLEHILGYTVGIAEVVHHIVTGELFPLAERELINVSD